MLVNYTGKTANLEFQSPRLPVGRCIHSVTAGAGQRGRGRKASGRERGSGGRAGIGREGEAPYGAKHFHCEAMAYIAVTGQC